MASETEELWNIHDAISELIRFSDTKATALLAINGIIGGFYFSNISTLRDIFAQKLSAFLLFDLSFLFLIVSVFFAAYCILPRLSKTNNGNLLYFASIVTKYKDAAAYKQAIAGALRNKEEWQAYISQDIWNISKVAKTKYNIVKYSLIFFVAALLSSGAFMFAAIN